MTLADNKNPSTHILHSILPSFLPSILSPFSLSHIRKYIYIYIHIHTLSLSPINLFPLPKEPPPFPTSYTSQNKPPAPRALSSQITTQAHITSSRYLPSFAPKSSHRIASAPNPLQAHIKPEWYATLHDLLA